MDRFDTGSLLRVNAAGALPEPAEDVLREASGVLALVGSVRRLLAPAAIDGRRARSAAARRAALGAHGRLHAERLSLTGRQLAVKSAGDLRHYAEGLRADAALAYWLAAA